MGYIATFQRVEKKYMLTAQQYKQILPVINQYMQADEYGLSTISNLYLDTDDDLLVRRSIEKPVYKEKLRLRSYGVPGDDGVVYLEIKKKVRGVVYKRRISMTAKEAMAYLLHGETPHDNGQIFREIDEMKTRYGLYPKLYLAYDRVAYFEREPSASRLRITIDRHIRSRETDIDLRMGDAGKLLLDSDMRLMEIKTAGAMPIWLCDALSKYRVFPTSFSKYGRVYQERAAMLSPLSATRHAKPAPSVAAMGYGFTPALSPRLTRV